MALRTQPNITLHASERALVMGFERVKKQALGWVFEGYPVGDYYEAALPGRDAFCMRDVSHQCVGGEALGLSSHNKNMLLKFAASISEARDYCGYWEIDRFNRPCPVDYRNDADFWYNLPANFDVLCACWRMYEWTGDRDYIAHPDFDLFFAYTMENYIKRWDRDGDGLPDCTPQDGRRGIASYDEGDFARAQYSCGSDLLAVMARAHICYARMCQALERHEQAAIYAARGEALLRMLNEAWYCPRKGYAVAKGRDGGLIFAKEQLSGQSFLYWDALSSPERAQPLLDRLEAQMEAVQIEGLSHYPEILWRYGRAHGAQRALARLMDPACPRREYPEASFCAVGAVVTGLMGVAPGVAEGRRCIRTLSGLTQEGYVELRQIPVLGGQLNVLHQEHTRTTVSWEDGAPLIWRAAFHQKGRIFVEGQEMPACRQTDPFTGRTLTYADIPLASGQECCAVLHAQ